MAQEDVIARRYAKGLVEEAAANGSIAAVRRDLRTLTHIMDPRSGSEYAPEFLRLLESPTLEPADKTAFIESIARQAGFAPETEAFLKVLLERNRVGVMPRVAVAFAELAGPLTGVYTATVHTARRLREDQADRLRNALSEALGAEVSVRQVVEPGLLAGAKIVVGDKTIDGTVLGKLERLKHRLMTQSVHGIAEFREETAGAAANQ